ncbi:hypothetical protein EES39_37320 [Streptomyces sp. ADI92-24]|nr:hypothetical protein EES39_37320 [Streptomyces sp. ADI92-24]
MPPANRDDGLRAAVTLREAYAGLPVVVLSQYVERSYVVRLLDSYQGAAVGDRSAGLVRTIDPTGLVHLRFPANRLFAFMPTLCERRKPVVHR